MTWRYNARLGISVIVLNRSNRQNSTGPARTRESNHNSHYTPYRVDLELEHNISDGHAIFGHLIIGSKS